MQIKACERMREKAKDESIQEGLSVSSHRADRESDREEKDLSFSLAREDLIKFFWPPDDLF